MTFKIFSRSEFTAENDGCLVLVLKSDKNKYGWVAICVEMTFDQSGCVILHLLKNMMMEKEFARYEDTEIRHIGYDPNLGLPQNSETI